MDDLVALSRSFDQEADVTSGVTLCGDDCIQVTEGPAAAIDDFVAHLRKHAGHLELHVIHREATTERLFPDRPITVLDTTRQHSLLKSALTHDGAASAPELAARLTTLFRAAMFEDPASAPPPAGTAVARPRTTLDIIDRHVATALLSPFGRVLCASGAYAAMFGTTPAAIQGQRRREFAGEDAAALEAKRETWRALHRGETCSLEYMATRSDGGEIWIESRLVPSTSQDGQLSEVVEIATDITARQRRSEDEQGQIIAVDASQIVLHLSVAGEILYANQRFLDEFGYRAEELTGRHHRVLIPVGATEDPAYHEFWRLLGEGMPQSGEFKRIGRDGRDIWLRVNYNPVADRRGRLVKIVAHATSVTADRLRQAEYQWQVAAIRRSHAVIMFTMDGLILDANENFLDAVGYRLDQIQGRHHRMFVDPAYAHSAEYAQFWRSLARGQHQAGEYRRIGRNGTDVWLQATYSPVFDVDGQPTKVIEYATVTTDEKLRQAEHQSQIAAMHKAQGVISFELDGSIVDANDNFLDMMGYRLGEVRGQHHSIFVDRDEASSDSYHAFWAALGAGHHQGGEFKRRAKDGREVWLQATYNPVMDLSGRPFRVIKYATEITREKLRQADVQGQIEAIRKSTGVIAFAMDGTILEANQPMLDSLGYTMAELDGRHHSVLVEPAYAQSEEYKAFWQALRAGEFTSGLYRRVGRTGQPVWIQASYNPILDLNGKPFKIIKYAADVTCNVALSEAHEDAKRQAQHDPATSLPNRVRLSSFMAQVMARPNARLVVFYLDLDRFKPVNDTHGHEAGDRVLGEVADRLRRQLSREQLAARVGGDEFVVVTPDMPDDEINAFATSLLQAVGMPIQIAGTEVTVGVSIGIAIGPTDGIMPDELLRCADTALYQAKQAGGDAFRYYDAEMNDRLSQYRNMVDDLRTALQDRQFFLEYQPRFTLAPRRICSVEALIRWNHPERGRVNPADFIPVAEKSGLITRIGQWVLETACRAAVEWPTIGVSVNVSPVQFHASDFVEAVKAVLASTGLSPQRLELEITEGVIIQNAQRAQQCLQELSKLGVSLAMDDFGTGYSSLSSLRTFPFNVIKIDRQFVTDMQGRQGGRDVVKAILSMGKGLDMRVTAEGVETATQLDMLASDECSEVQGFFLARPMRSDALEELLQAQA